MTIVIASMRKCLWQVDGVNVQSVVNSLFLTAELQEPSLARIDLVSGGGILPILCGAVMADGKAL